LEKIRGTVLIEGRSRATPVAPSKALQITPRHLCVTKARRMPLGSTQEALGGLLRIVVIVDREAEKAL
jgi:hypothetical protein